MKQAVADAFWNFTAAKEGWLDYMYTDVKGLVTTGIGNLIDPISAALGLPWRHRGSGNPASQSEITSAWNIVKTVGGHGTSVSKMGGGAQKKVWDAQGIDLYLEQNDIKSIVEQRLANNETILRKYFPAYDSWPADAQLGLLSMAWAMGAAFAPKFPSFTRAANASPPDFNTAAIQSHIAGLNNDRQTADLQLFQNAAKVLADGLDPDVLLFSVSPVAQAAIKAGKQFQAQHPKEFPWAMAVLGIGLAWGSYEVYKQYRKY